MASQAQYIANRENARLSTGPKSAEGKARSSQNHLRHGLSLGILSIEPAEQARFCEFEANLHAELKPEGMLEREALQQFIDAAWRLRKVHVRIAALGASLPDDPFVVPEAEAELRQLTRYRAAAEMVAYRAIRALRELQNTRLARLFHLTPPEQQVVPPTVHPPVKAQLAGAARSHNDREIWYEIHGQMPFHEQLPLAPPPSCEPACSG